LEEKCDNTGVASDGGHGAFIAVDDHEKHCKGPH
jgi:hypothetical protein